MHIVLERHGYGWAAWFYGADHIPEDVELPLPYASSATLVMVRNAMAKRFPKAEIVYRTGNGILTKAEA